MANKKMQAVQGQSPAQLRDAEANLRKELFDLKFQHATRSLTDTMGVRKKRRELARVLTAQTQAKQPG